MKDCEYFGELISRMVDEDLNDNESAELEAHMKSCPECRALYRAFMSVSDAIGDNLEDVPEGMTEKNNVGHKKGRT